MNAFILCKNYAIFFGLGQAQLRPPIFAFRMLFPATNEKPSSNF